MASSNYSKAKKYFLKTVTCDKAYVKSAICLLFISSYENEDIAFEIKSSNDCLIITEREKVFYKYFLDKHKGNDYIHLLEYIYVCILPHVDSKNSFYFMVFDRELKCLAKSIAPNHINCSE